MSRTLSITIAVSMFAATAAAQDIGTDAQRAAGKETYDHLCAQCHGDDGDGSGVAKAYFLPRPRDFTYGLFKIRTTPSGALPTTDDLKDIIREGMPYTGMPGWPELSDGELTNLAYYIKTFNDGFADPDDLFPIEIPSPPKSSEESIARGHELYVENKCADCHGVYGRGDGKSSPTLKNDWEEPIWPADLTRRWTFRGGATRKDIYRTFTTGLNGTPMPSYADLIAEEDRWHLVNYVYSLSRDEPDYATVVTTSTIDGELDVSQGPALFADATPAFFPIFGQIIEPGRNFYPSCNGIEVKSLCNTDEIAFLLTWHDMMGDTTGINGLMMPAPMFDPDVTEPDGAGIYSDAVAIQTPSQNPTGAARPYFIFGDAKRSTDVWLADLARTEGELLVANGIMNFENTGEVISMYASYADGEWNVILKRPRRIDGGLAFEDGNFVPIAFSVWDGYRNERGNKRGLSGWYHVYIAPTEKQSRALPVAGYGLLTLLVEVGVIGMVRRRYRGA